MKLCCVYTGGSIRFRSTFTETEGDWFWVVKHNPRLWNHYSCQEQFTKVMWRSLLFSSADLLTACPCLDQFSDEDWRRLNLLPKLKSRIRNGEQFRKLIALTRHSFRTHISDKVTQQ